MGLLYEIMSSIWNRCTRVGSVRDEDLEKDNEPRNEEMPKEVRLSHQHLSRGGHRSEICADVDRVRNYEQ